MTDIDVLTALWMRTPSYWLYDNHLIYKLVIENEDKATAYALNLLDDKIEKLDYDYVDIEPMLITAISCGATDNNTFIQRLNKK